MTNNTEQLVQIGMRAAIRDVQDYVDANISRDFHDKTTIFADDLQAYLLALLITSGAYEDIHD